MPNVLEVLNQQHAKRNFEFRPNTFDEKKRSVEVVFSTGARVKRRDWLNRDYIEELEISDAAIDFSRINKGTSVLDSHSGWFLRNVIGVTEEGRIENGEAIAKIRFSERDEVKGIVDDVKNGIIRNISVGYDIIEYVDKEEEGIGKVRTVTKWTPCEISFVAIPADADAQTRSAEINEERNMPSNNSIDLEKIKQDVRDKTLAEVREIVDLCVVGQKDIRSFSSFIEKGSDPQAVRSLLIAERNANIGSEAQAELNSRHSESNNEQFSSNILVERMKQRYGGNN